MIKIPELRLLELLEDLKERNMDDDNVLELERLIIDFLDSDKKKRIVTKEMERAFHILKTSSITIEMERHVKEIEDITNRLYEIFHRIDEASSVPTILSILKQEQKISREAYEKLLHIAEEEHALTLLFW